MTPEEKARQRIDSMLVASGWTVQTKEQLNLAASRGVALGELAVATGEPDYTLFVDGKAIGTVEAKPEGHSLTGVEEQSTKYVTGVPASLPAWRRPLPFCYESTGSETRFTNRLDPEPRSRHVFSFHCPETLLDWVEQEKQLAQRSPAAAAGGRLPLARAGPGHHRPRRIPSRRSPAGVAPDERGGGVGVGGVGQPPARHPPSPVHFAESLPGRTLDRR